MGIAEILMKRLRPSTRAFLTAVRERPGGTTWEALARVVIPQVAGVLHSRGAREGRRGKISERIGLAAWPGLRLMGSRWRKAVCRHLPRQGVARVRHEAPDPGQSLSRGYRSGNRPSLFDGQGYHSGQPGGSGPS